MDLFLSWSGERSKKLALIFNEWVLNVLPTLDIYISLKQIKPGERWIDSIGKGLQNNYTGIFFLVRENISSPWINFEAGAISKNVKNSRVIPLLHNLTPEEISSPLTQFQAMSIEKESIYKVIKVINDSINDSRRINNEQLRKIFEKWYPDFESKYNEFTDENPDPVSGLNDNNSAILDESGQIEEILRIVRGLSLSQLGSFEDRYSRYENYNKISADDDFEKNSTELILNGLKYKIYFKENLKKNIRFEIIALIKQLTTDLGGIPTYEELSAEFDVPTIMMENMFRLRKSRN
ncbi:TPA: TIR domain-containing protein [Salmonella enterica]|nr:TIR domain-containing protein [Salmonella enterica]HAU2858749.1 TIR domain-containing protein [Salmonella enterica]HAU2923359.1 TIR domain-containing protein [Salmonella enterica]HAU2928203.1 TIR domain-containing protein [Salmonella enterica]HAU3184128.1 TIR domain-containing protein [Salmonella enterica]